jgi:regulator of sigma E protease
MSTIIMLLSLAVALSFVVFVHELGHLLAARRSKVVVEEFGIGYPPRLFAFWHGEGRIVIDGQEIVIPRKLRLPTELRVGSLVLYETAKDAKGRQILTGIDEVGAEEPMAASASSVGLLDAGTVYSVNAIPFGGFCKMLGEEDPEFPGSLASKSKRARIFVLAAGALMNLLTAVLFFAVALMLGAPAVADPENAVVNSVASGSPAEAAGLQPGDIVLKTDDTDVLEMQDLQEYTMAHLGEPVVLTVQRGDQLLQIAVVPREEPPQGEGPMGIVLSPRTTIQKVPWYEALWMGLKEVVALTGFIFTVPVQVIRGLIPAELARPVGPIGVGRLVGDAVQYSLDTGWWYPAMQMMGILSVALAVTNLLPLPGLDGGRILFVVVEAIRGRRLDPAKEGLVHLVGLLLLVMLMVFITWQDFVNPVPGLDWSTLF